MQERAGGGRKFWGVSRAVLEVFRSRSQGHDRFVSVKGELLLPGFPYLCTLWPFDQSVAVVRQGLRERFWGKLAISIHVSEIHATAF